MVENISLDELVDRVGNKFLLSAAVAKRAIQIKEGDNPLIEGDDINAEQPIRVAIREIENERLEMGITEQRELSPSEAIFAEDDDFEEKVDESSEEEKESAKKDVKKKKSKSLSA